jgi:restriction system protein
VLVYHCKVPIPKFSDLFSDVLLALSDGELWHRRDLRLKIISQLKLTDEELAETMSGGGNRASSRVHWASEFLVQARAAARPKRGYLQITDLGRALLVEQPAGITLERLKETEGIKAWRRRSKTSAHKGAATASGIQEFDPGDSEVSPEEQIEGGVARLRQSVADELLERIRSEGWQYFEHAVLRVLHGVGYGQGEEDLLHLGKTGDGGVDGVINQDRLGLEQLPARRQRGEYS